MVITTGKVWTRVNRCFRCAQRNYESYVAELSKLMNRFGVFNEYELLSGAVVKFMGKHKRSRARELRQQEQPSTIVEGVGNYVALSEGGGDVLAPDAERKDGGGGAVRRELPFVALAVGFLALALIVVVVLRLVLGSSADSVSDAIQKLLSK